MSGSPDFFKNRAASVGPTLPVFPGSTLEQTQVKNLIFIRWNFRGNYSSGSLTYLSVQVLIDGVPTWQLGQKENIAVKMKNVIKLRVQTAEVQLHLGWSVLKCNVQAHGGWRKRVQVLFLQPMTISDTNSIDAPSDFYTHPVEKKNSAHIFLFYWFAPVNVYTTSALKNFPVFKYG